MTEDLRYSRSGATNPRGKYTEEIKCLLDEDAKTALCGLAFAAGVPLSEYLRNVITTHLWGHAHVLRLAHQQIAGRPGSGQE